MRELSQLVTSAEVFLFQIFLVNAPRCDLNKKLTTQSSKSFHPNLFQNLGEEQTGSTGHLVILVWSGNWQSENCCLSVLHFSINS